MGAEQRSEEPARALDLVECASRAGVNDNAGLVAASYRVVDDFRIMIQRQRVPDGAWSIPNRRVGARWKRIVLSDRGFTHVDRITEWQAVDYRRVCEVVVRRRDRARRPGDDEYPQRNGRDYEHLQKVSAHWNLRSIDLAGRHRADWAGGSKPLTSSKVGCCSSSSRRGNP